MVPGLAASMCFCSVTALDRPVTSFTLQLKGDSSLLGNHVNSCAKKHFANAVFTGQNGKIFESKPLVKASCKNRKRLPPRPEASR